MLIFDIEADGLLEDCTKMHSLVIKNDTTGLVLSCCDQSQYHPIKEGLELLSEADTIAGHNILAYDIPVIKKLYPSWTCKAKKVDTLILSRLIHTNLNQDDIEGCTHFKPETKIPPKLYGRHSLKAWGYRLNQHKDEYDQWESWTPDMQIYCERDVEVTAALANYFKSRDYSETAIELEHDFAEIMIKQEINGVPFNTEEAEKLYSELFTELEQLRKTIATTVPPTIKEEVFTPKRDNKTIGYVKGVPFTKKKVMPFNANSRKQVFKFLNTKYNWTPDKKTLKGNPSLDAEVMEDIADVFPEAKLFQKYFTISLLMPKIKTGKQAWLKNVGKDGRIHGYVNTNGAVTGRCTHSRPNLSQVPSARKYKGKECRSLFHAPHGMAMVGCDASGLELRCLAHFLTPHDDGKYTKILLEKDVHTTNMQAAGLDDRDVAKRFIYAFLYGAGNAKLGSLVYPKLCEAERAKCGSELRSSFSSKTDGIQDLLKELHKESRSKTIKGLDGRELHVRSTHKALNTLLQSAGGLIMKKATVIYTKELKKQGYDILQALNVHDENQVFCYYEDSEAVGSIMKQSIISAGEFFNFRCPLDGTYNIGENWYETH